MKELCFEWDEKKAASNEKKHGVSFEEARTVFYDENAIQFYDPDHSEEEDRFILLGLHEMKPTTTGFRKMRSLLQSFSV